MSARFQSLCSSPKRRLFKGPTGRRIGRYEGDRADILQFCQPPGAATRNASWGGHSAARRNCQPSGKTARKKELDNDISVRLKVIELYAILNHDLNVNVPKGKMVLSLKSIIAVNYEDETKIKCCYLIGLIGKNEHELIAYVEKCKHDGSKKVRIAARHSLEENANSKNYKL